MLAIAAPVAWLQWGHGDEAVEEGIGAAAIGTWEQLQWGHGDEAVEEKNRWPVARSEHELQWGHGDEAVEETGIGLGLADHLDASMGPRR